MFFFQLLNLSKIPSTILQSESSEKKSKAEQKINTIVNTPNKTGANINSIIDTLRNNQEVEKESNKYLLHLKGKIDSVNNPLNEGILRYSKKRGLYLSENASIREALGWRDAGAAKFEKKISGFDLEFGKKTIRENLISKIDEKLTEQNAHIDFLDDCIVKQEEKLSAEQIGMNREDSNTSHETKTTHNQDSNIDDELSEWPEKNIQDEPVRSMILKYLNNSQEDSAIHDDIDQFISSMVKTLEVSDSQSDSNTTSNPTTPQPPIESSNSESVEPENHDLGVSNPLKKPLRTFEYGRDLNSPDKPAQPVPNLPDSDKIFTSPIDQEFDEFFHSDTTLTPNSAEAIEKEFEALFKSEQKITDEQSVLPSSLIQRSNSEVGTRSQEVDMLKNLKRSQSDPTNNIKEITVGQVNKLKAIWEARSKPGSA
ncbi:hypothetical protein [Pseudomonas gingeri]